MLRTGQSSASARSVALPSSVNDSPSCGTHSTSFSYAASTEAPSFFACATCGKGMEGTGPQHTAVTPQR